jgi:hypothetical protein
MPASTPQERERLQQVIGEVQKVQVSGVPRGLEDLTPVAR